MSATKIYSPSSFFALIVPEAEPVRKHVQSEEQLQIHLMDLQDLISEKPAANQGSNAPAQIALRPAAKQGRNAPAKPAAQNTVPYSDSALLHHFQENGLTVEQMKHPDCNPQSRLAETGAV